MNRHLLAAGVTLGLLLAGAGGDAGRTAVAATAGEFQPAQLKGFPRGELTIERAQGRDSFRIWIADTPARHQQGLMWLKELPADHGMLFVLDAPRPFTIWMKNTYVPLDIVFIGTDGRIASIARNARPLSTDLIPSGGDVAGVLEILGGEADRRGIAIGDRLVYRATGR